MSNPKHPQIQHAIRSLLVIAIHDNGLNLGYRYLGKHDNGLNLDSDWSKCCMSLANTLSSVSYCTCSNGSASVPKSALGILGDITQRDIKEILGDITQRDIKEILGDTTQVDIEEILPKEILGDTTQRDIGRYYPKRY
ncbi:hypothetical protein Tco_0161179 [Tanacetum coccineum]